MCRHIDCPITPVPIQPIFCPRGRPVVARGPSCGDISCPRGRPVVARGPSCGDISCPRGRPVVARGPSCGASTCSDMERSLTNRGSSSPARGWRLVGSTPNLQRQIQGATLEGWGESLRNPAGAGDFNTNGASCAAWELEIRRWELIRRAGSRDYALARETGSSEAGSKSGKLEAAPTGDHQELETGNRQLGNWKPRTGNYETIPYTSPPISRSCSDCASCPARSCARSVRPTAASRAGCRGAASRFPSPSRRACRPRC
jgi:hypothetical protein